MRDRDNTSPRGSRAALISFIAALVRRGSVAVAQTQIVTEQTLRVMLDLGVITTRVAV